MVIKLDIVINNIMAKVVYFGKHISDKIRDANRVFSEILISPFIVRNERKIRYQTYDEFVEMLLLLQMFMVMLFLINL